MGEMDVSRYKTCSLSCSRVRLLQGLRTRELCNDSSCDSSIQTITGTGAVKHVWNALQCKVWIAYQLAFSEVLIVAVETILIARSK